MKIFLSWSGDLSRDVAQVLHDWLPSVIQTVETYVSAEDIEKGTRWVTDVAKELEATNFGIICLTPDNVAAPWVNFEAGALSRTIDRARVAPFLTGLKASDVQGPLVQFQLTVFDKDDVRRLLASINKAAEAEGEGLDEARLDSTFKLWWPSLEAGINAVLEKEISNKPEKSRPAKSSGLDHVSKVLEELLQLSRGQMKILSDRRGYGKESPIHMFDIVILEDMLKKLTKLHKLVDEYDDPDDLIQVGIVQSMFKDIENNFQYLRTLPSPTMHDSLSTVRQAISAIADEKDTVGTIRKRTRTRHVK